MAKSKKVKEVKVVRSDVYTITRELLDDGTYNLHRRNEGFNPLELLGMLEMTQKDIVDQISRRIPPAKIVTKTYVRTAKTNP